MSFLANELHWFVQCCTWYQMILDGVVKPSHCHGQTVSLVVWCNAESPSLLRISQSLWLDWICIRWRKTLAGHAVDSARPWQHKASELTGQSAATLHHKSGLHWDPLRSDREKGKDRRGEKRETQRKREKECRDGQKNGSAIWMGVGVGWGGLELGHRNWVMMKWPKEPTTQWKKTPTMHWDCFLSIHVSSGALPFCSVLSGSLIKQIPDWSWALPTPQGCRQLVTLSCRMLFLTPTLFYI